MDPVEVYKGKGNNSHGILKLSLLYLFTWTTFHMST